MKTLGTLLIVAGTLFSITIVLLVPGLMMIGVGALLRIASRSNVVEIRPAVTDDLMAQRISWILNLFRTETRAEILERERRARLARR